MIPFDFLGAENDLFVAPLKSPMAFDFTIILPHIEGLKARGGSTTLWRLYAHKKKCLPAQFVFFLGLLGTHTRDTPKPKPPHLPTLPPLLILMAFAFTWVHEYVYRRYVVPNLGTLRKLSPECIRAIRAHSSASHRSASTPSMVSTSSQRNLLLNLELPSRSLGL